MATTITKSVLQRPITNIPEIVDGDLSTYKNYTGSVWLNQILSFKSFNIPSNGTITKAVIAVRAGSNNSNSNLGTYFGYNEYSENHFLLKYAFQNTTCAPQYFYNERTAADITAKLTSLGIHSGNIKSYFNDTDNNCQCVLRRGPKTAILNSYNIDIYDAYMEVFYTVPAYTLTVKSNNTTYGTVSGDGDYEAGTTATLTATPKTGYKFKQWNDGNTSATRTVTVSADATYTATFELITYTATFKNHDGTVLETKSVSHGSTPSYTGATPTKPSTAQYSYTFSGWSPSLSAITGNTTYTAQFTSTVRSYAITANAGTGGTVTGGGNYNYGSNATLTATPAEGYRFKRWSDGNTDNPRTVSVTGAATYTAEFEIPAIKQVYVGTSLAEVYRGTSLFKEINAGTSISYKP